MVRGRLKSRTFRRLQKRTPGNRTVTHYARRKPSPATCAQCGAVLKGLKRVRPTESQNLPKSQKRVSRPYGGNLCSSCTRAVLRAQARL